MSDAPLPANNDESFEDEIDKFMDASSPDNSPYSTPSRKRTHSDATGVPGSDDFRNHDENTSPAYAAMAHDGLSTPATGYPGPLQAHSRSVAMLSNGGRPVGAPIDFIRRQGKRLKLTAEDIAETEQWAKRPASEREALLYLELKAQSVLLKQIVLAQPKYEVSEDFKKNIEKHCLATLLSTCISNYKGVVPYRITDGLLKKYCSSDLPSGGERNAADYGKVRYWIQYYQTQIRAKWKKAIHASVHDLEKKDCTDLYPLAAILANGQCAISVQWCGRVALMRKVYVEKGEKNFWSNVDSSLNVIRTKAAGKEGQNIPDERQKRVNKVLQGIMQSDRNTYGDGARMEIKNIPQVDFQQEVDDLVLADG